LGKRSALARDLLWQDGRLCKTSAYAIIELTPFPACWFHPGITPPEYDGNKPPDWQYALYDMPLTSIRGTVFCGPNSWTNRISAMAKANTIKIKLESTADTGYFYVTKKNARTKTEKMTVKKYDPVARKHVEFKETKIK